MALCDSVYCANLKACRKGRNINPRYTDLTSPLTFSLQGLTLLEAKASLCIASAKHAAGRYVEARHLACQAGALFKHCDDADGQMEAACALGVCQFGLWRFREASQSLLHALTLARRDNKYKFQVKVLILLSRVLADLGHQREALEHAHAALTLSKETQEASSMTTSALEAVATAHLRAGDHDKAAQCAEELLDKCESTNDLSGKQTALRQVGEAQLALGNVHDAEHLFLRQRDTALSLGDMAGAALALQGISSALVALRQYDLALDTVRQEEILWDCIGDSGIRPLLLFHLCPSHPPKITILNPYMCSMPGRRRLCLNRICKLLEKMKCKREAMEIRRREGVAIHSLAPLFSIEDEHQQHFDEDRIIIKPRLCHYEKPHPWTLPVLPSQYLIWGNRFHLSSSPGRRIMLNFPAGYIKKDFEPIKRQEAEEAPPPKKTLNLV